MPDGLSHDLVVAMGGAVSLGTLYTVVRIVVTLVRTMREGRVADRRVALADAETRRAMEEATHAGVGTLGELVLTLRGEVNRLRRDLESQSKKYTSQLRDVGQKYTSFRSLVLRFLGEIAAVMPDMPDDIRQRVQTAVDRFREDADAT